MSDNGGWKLDGAGGDNYPLKDGKCNFYEGGIRTVSVIKNEQIKNKEFNSFVHSIDVLPTILDFCGYKKEIKIDGSSIYDQIVNQGLIKKRNIILAFYTENLWCFLIGNLKFLKMKDSFECYDIINDPFEKNNIINEKLPLFEKDISEQIKSCLSERVYENFEKDNKDSIIEKCKKIKFWGQHQKNEIKMLSCNQEENKKIIASKNNFLEANGYEIFYK
jgi:hypothetical protein